VPMGMTLISAMTAIGLLSLRCRACSSGIQ
jgi:hypothetical protein